jgi:tetratricopeptide (TPR) repeat protein
MIYVIQSTANPLFGGSVVDAVVYAQWAPKMVDGVWLWDRVDNYLPIYPAFLAVQQIIFGPNPFVNKVLQSILGAFSAVLMAQVAARAWNRQVGLITGPLSATDWMLAFFCLLSWPDWQNLEARKSARHDYFIGKHYENSGRMDAAIRSFQKSMYDFPWDPDSPHRIGRILIGQKKPDQAMRYLQEALGREPQFPEVMNAIAYIHLLDGDLNAAEKKLIKSLGLAPANQETLMLMANIQRPRGQFDA